MIILNLLVKENNKVKAVIPFVSQASLISEIKHLITEIGDDRTIEESQKLTNVNVPYFISENPEIFRGTKYEGTRVFMCELSK